MRTLFLFTLLVAALTPPAAIAAPSSANNKALEKALARFPHADTDKDGILTMEEAVAYRKKVQGGTDRKLPNKVLAPAPTHENVTYGPYDRNVLDVWLPESDQPTPVIVYIHGGGFVGGNKEKVRGSPQVQMALDRGVAFASIQYRFRHPDNGDLSDPQHAGIQDILRDAARAVQFIRSRADEYNLDKRVVAYGGSAGAGTSIWLAFHDDLADPESDDPVLRESSRLTAAGMLNGQFTYDVAQWDDFIKGGDIIKTHGDGSDRREFGRFFGLDEETYQGTVGDKWRADVDMRGLITPDDPPVFAMTGNPDVPPTTRGIYNHHPRHPLIIEECCREHGVEVLCLVPKVRPADDQRLKEDKDLMMTFFFQKLSLSSEQ